MITLYHGSGSGGYLKQVCIDGGLASEADDLSLTDVMKKLREQHPKFSRRAPHDAHTERVLKAMGTICDALNPLRNRGSLAHPNEELLDETDAMLGMAIALQVVVQSSTTAIAIGIVLCSQHVIRVEAALAIS